MVKEWLGEQQPGSGLLFRVHNEHIKTQQRCKQELRDDGKTPGIDLGEDMDYKNIIAALEVKCDGGTMESERFGLVVRKLDIVSMPPTNAAKPPLCLRRSFQRALRLIGVADAGLPRFPHPSERQTGVRRSLFTAHPISSL